MPKLCLPKDRAMHLINLMEEHIDKNRRDMNYAEKILKEIKVELGVTKKEKLKL